MPRRAHTRQDGDSRQLLGRPLFTRLGRRGGHLLPPADNDNRAPSLHQVRRLVSPARVLETLIAWFARPP